MYDELKAAVRDVPDFPIKGILFKDISPILQDARLFRTAVDAIADRHKGRKIDAVVGIDARGFIFAGAVAYKLGVGFVPVRKKGKLPYKTVVTSYTLEYGSETSEMHVDAIRKGGNVIIVDDLLATGGTAMAAATLVKQVGGNIAEIDFLIELSFLNGRERLKEFSVFAAIAY
ncbi:MAG TPA: adenine phosphoribosyltransferase [Verrucomicrobiae bacterium]|nr:adenine phosphoribosyltransferase [Verrucomicrobiae bacterium]